MKMFLTLLITAGISLIAGCEDNYVPVGSHWHKLHQLKPDGETFRVTGQHARLMRQYKVDEAITFNVTSERAGQLWVVSVDPKDEVEIVFPNAKANNNHIAAGETVTLPTAGANWDFALSGPAGPNLVAFIVTTGDTPVEEILGAVEKKEVDKAIRLIDRKGAWAIDRLVIDVKAPLK